MTPGPRRLLLNDEGNSALHFVDLDAPSDHWVHRGPGRDLQIIGRHQLLRSTPDGFEELNLAARGNLLRRVALPDLPGPVESARRSLDGRTTVLGNGPGGIFVWEVDSTGRPSSERARNCRGIEKGRLLRQTAEGSLLFCSETEGRHVVHELDWRAGRRDLFTVPPSALADSMVKAVRIVPDILTVSSGYAASLLRVDIARRLVLQTIGGKRQPELEEAVRPLSPFFFSGYQMLGDRGFLVANWQGHSSERNGQGYQVLNYDSAGNLVWAFDQTAFPAMSSINNVIALDGLDTSRLHDEPNGILVPLGPSAA